MEKVSSQEFDRFINENRAIGPDVDFSNDNYVCEDWWNENHTDVIGCRKYFNDGEILEYLTL